MHSFAEMLLPTTQFAQTRAKFISLFQDSLPSSFNESIKFECEFGHALSQILKVEVHGGQLGERTVRVRNCRILRLRRAERRGAC